MRMMPSCFMRCQRVSLNLKKLNLPISLKIYRHLTIWQSINSWIQQPFPHMHMYNYTIPIELWIVVQVWEIGMDQ